MKVDYNNYTLWTRYHFENQSLAHLSDTPQSETEQTEAEAILVLGKIYGTDKQTLYFWISEPSQSKVVAEKFSTGLC